jgi:hypothetical protein
MGRFAAAREDFRQGAALEANVAGRFPVDAVIRQADQDTRNVVAAYRQNLPARQDVTTRSDGDRASQRLTRKRVRILLDQLLAAATLQELVKIETGPLMPIVSQAPVAVSPGEQSAGVEADLSDPFVDDPSADADSALDDSGAAAQEEPSDEGPAGDDEPLVDEEDPFS